ncbi:hypothetical protein PAECIP112173_01948 [Paenibacillus sp. JJ-100]|uniref:pentapeptide repeat-containing protein n=1 Tax=Paenibacillus sp. JJ-100 TaxID=2974896 RepID=UPI0022FF9332|nr:pentapeptide repeat-containing protein [Paenibacillus sp. JJ-100]CAI6065105.1 hypothetical protein PAECIP112173_01948 [Paenibacillus sp. JJ-100]
MNRKDSLKHFYADQVEQERVRLMDDLKRTLESRSTELTAKYMEHFTEFIKEVALAQQVGTKGKIAYIQYSMLRTEVLNGAMNVLVEACDSSWLLDRSPVRTYYSAQWAYDCVERMIERLKQTLPSYQGAVTAVELEHVRLQQVALVNRYLVYFIRRCGYLLEDLELHLHMQLEQNFEIRLGEYLDASECVFRLDRRERSIEEIGEELEESNGIAVMYAHFQGLSMAEMECSDLDFRFSRFEHVDLKWTDFQRCMLVGTRWRNCEMDGVNFSDSLIHGADFSGCSLQGAVFRGVVGDMGQPEGLVQGPGYDAVNFKNSNLEGADFRGANLRGANFSGANLVDTLWDNANIDGAIFDDAERRTRLSNTFA